MKSLKDLKRKVLPSRLDLCAGDPELVSYHSADIFVISYPKSGRTWLRFMLAKYLSIAYNFPFNPQQDLTDLTYEMTQVPRVAFAHDFSSITEHKQRIRLKADDLPQHKIIYRTKKVVFLVRDLRDVIVSYFFECTERRKLYSGDISSFIRNDYFGISKMVCFLNIWYENRKVPKDFLLVHYEQMIINPVGELLKIAQFLEFPIHLEAAQLAVEHASFRNMKNMEQQGKLDGTQHFGVKGQTCSQEAFKVRKGKIHGFRDYLSQCDIDYLDTYIISNLSPFYGYTCF